MSPNLATIARVLSKNATAKRGYACGLKEYQSITARLD
jgi:hypothetical protein